MQLFERHCVKEEESFNFKEQQELCLDLCFVPLPQKKRFTMFERQFIVLNYLGWFALPDTARCEQQVDCVVCIVLLPC